MNLHQKWFHNLHKNTPMRIFCFPFAGGSANTYYSWQKKMPHNIQICPIQLPGRWDRINEKPYTRMNELVDDLFKAITHHIDIPYAFFGHSFGSIISFNLYRKLRKESCLLPKHLFFSAARAPQITTRVICLHKLNDDEFINAMAKNGMPFLPEILADPDMLSISLKILKADFEALETREYFKEEKINTPMSVYGGLHDIDVGIESLKAWKEQAGNKFELKMFNGDHFYLKPSEDELISTIIKTCEVF